MAVNNLHQTNSANEVPDLLSGLTTREVYINGIDSETVVAKCPNYPFEGQTRYKGTIAYDEKPEFGKGRELEFRFQARSQSGLLIIKSEVDASLENILGQVNEATEPDFRIYRRLSPQRKSLWKFIQEANSVVEVTIIDEQGEELTLNEIDKDRDEVIGNYPIEDATFSYKYNDENILVKYASGSLQIDADNPEATEYIIQLFERDVIYSE